MKKTKKPYNTTELNVESAFDRNYFHRDQIAHYFRWAFVGRFFEHSKNKGTGTIVDFGCGRGSLASVLYVNRWAPKRYIGLDIREPKNFGLCPNNNPIEWAEFHQTNLVKDDMLHKGEFVTSFEVLEHVGKHNIDIFMQNFKECGTDDATYFLSTPSYDGINCAANHTYDAQDGNGDMCQELTIKEVEAGFERNGLEVIGNWGTFASKKDYKELLDVEYPGLFDRLNEYYSRHTIPVFFAPLFPKQSRNNIWVCKRKESNKQIKLF